MKLEIEHTHTNKKRYLGPQLNLFAPGERGTFS